MQRSVTAIGKSVGAIDLNRPGGSGEWSRREPSDMDGKAREGERSGASESTAATSAIALLIFCDCSRRGPTYFKLGAHFLDLRILLFQAFVNCLHCRFQFLYFAMRF